MNSLFNKINLKYKNCYFASIIYDLRSLGSELNKCKIIYPYVTENMKLNDDIVKIINISKNILKKWYMIELDSKNGIFYIPFYINHETYTIFNSDTKKLNHRQKFFKNFLKNKKYYLGYGIGVFTIMKIC